MTLLELASLAKAAPDDPPILPARVHMLFRGLPGLWACANPQCSEIARSGTRRPNRRSLRGTAANCACGSQVYELHSCRSCGLSVARANVGSPAGVEHLWQDNGRAYAGETGLIDPIHVCFEDPMPQDCQRGQAGFPDLSSGRIDGSGSFVREIWLPPLMAPKLFDSCPRCGAACGPTAAGGHFRPPDERRPALSRIDSGPGARTAAAARVQTAAPGPQGAGFFRWPPDGVPPCRHDQDLLVPR